MHIYLDKKDKELVKMIKVEALKRKRSVAFIVKEKLRKAYGLNGNSTD